ncbi:hypothetical protein F240042I4_14390 [Eisenbergiella tayi]
MIGSDHFFNKGFLGFEILIGIGICKRPQGITCFNPDAGIIFVIDRRIGPCALEIKLPPAIVRNIVMEAEMIKMRI